MVAPSVAWSQEVLCFKIYREVIDNQVRSSLPTTEEVNTGILLLPSSVKIEALPNKCDILNLKNWAMIKKN